MSTRAGLEGGWGVASPNTFYNSQKTSSETSNIALFTTSVLESIKYAFSIIVGDIFVGLILKLIQIYINQRWGNLSW